jgi:hypothetical protein
MHGPRMLKRAHDGQRQLPLRQVFEPSLITLERPCSAPDARPAESGPWHHPSPRGGAPYPTGCGNRTCGVDQPRARLAESGPRHHPCAGGGATHPTGCGNRPCGVDEPWARLAESGPRHHPSPRSGSASSSSNGPDLGLRYPVDVKTGHGHRQEQGR